MPKPIRRRAGVSSRHFGRSWLKSIRVAVPFLCRIKCQQGCSSGRRFICRTRPQLHEGKPVFLHDVQRSALKPLRQKIFDEVCAVRRRKPSAQPFVNWPEKLLDPLHAARLSESSSKPRRGIASPMPTRSARISQGRSSGSQISSMLARLKIVVA